MVIILTTQIITSLGSLQALQAKAKTKTLPIISRYLDGYCFLKKTDGKIK